MLTVPPNTYCVIVCGAPTWANYEAVKYWISLLPNKTWIVHGTSTTVDTFIIRAAATLGHELVTYGVPIPRGRYGATAVARRNQALLDRLPVQGVFAFGVSECVDDMTRRAKDADVSLLEIEPDMSLRKRLALTQDMFA